MKKRIIASAVIGNILEWYDFSLYGYFATIIAHLFFPATNKTLSLLATFGVFAVGFFSRPIGAALFGHFGDRFGRKKTLAASVLLMAIPTTLIGLLPTYAEIGIWSAVLLTVCRLIQGIAGGGELPGSVVYLVEHAPTQRRNQYAGWALLGGAGGVLLASAVCVLVTTLSVNTAYAMTAWRLPFIFGIVLGVVGLYLRLRMPETPEFSQLLQRKTTIKHPLLTILRQKPQLILLGISLLFLPAMSFYLIFVYLPSYLTLYLAMPLHTAMLTNTICMLLVIILFPVGGYFSERWSKKNILIANSSAMIILAYPLFLLIGHATLTSVCIAQLAFAILIAFCYPAILAGLIDLFSAEMRYTGVALSQSIATIFGGIAPMVATTLIHTTNNLTAPSLYLIFAGIVMLSATYLLYKSNKREVLCQPGF